jgi:Reverse transcriptase (RNA-dependent DNA polymerase)
LDRSILNKEIYVKYRNKLNILIRKTEKDFYSSKFKAAVGNMKDTWKIISSCLKSKTKPPLTDSFVINGKNTENIQEIVNGFNNYFSNVGLHLASSIPKSNVDHASFLKTPKVNSFSFSPTDPLEIMRLALEIKNKSSYGYDDIPVSIMKLSVPCIAYPLSILINSSFSTGIFPDALKIGKLCPVFKAGDKSLFSNYRPISVLPSFSKIYEKSIHARLASYLEANDILFDYQFGFRKKHSTYMAITNLYDKISNAVDKNEFVIAIFIDLAKAFDTIDFNILYDKLSYYGIRGIALDLFKSYLTDRCQFVHSSGSSSDMQNITYGVPQGSILGPLLFILYINDIAHCSMILQPFLFADDTTLLNSDKDFDKLINVTNIELVKLSNWFRANKLSLNVNKTNYILFGSKHLPDPTTYRVTLNEICLERVTYTKFLGIYIDDKLNWSEHINYICIKVSRGLGIIKRLKPIFPPNILTTLYHTLIYPYLNYCCIVWGSAYSNTLNDIEILQNRAVRIITNSPYRSSACPLFKQLNLLQVTDLYSFQVILFMYQVYHKNLPHSCLHFFVQNDITHNTRRSNYFKLFSYRTNIRKKSISIAGPTLWNKIPNELQNSRNVNTFKFMLKNWLIDKST